MCLLEFCHAGGLSSPSIVVFHGKELHEPFDLSAVAPVGKYIVAGSDEGHVIQILERKGWDTYELARKYSIPDGQETDRTDKEDPEIDIEGIAANGQVVYIVGSHSRKRSKVEVRNPKRHSHDDNRERLRENEPEEARRALFRVTLDDDGKLVGDVDPADLWSAIDKFEELRPFTEIPSKENGIDIEGIAAHGDKIYVGFRGPVLRENWVPVMVTEFDDPIEQAELRFVNLGGLGIRDIVALDDKLFLLIAGPMGDGPGGYHIYSWNGLDCIPGKNGAKGAVRHLGQIPTDRDAKAEGIALLPNDRDDSLRILIVFDGPERGNPISFTLSR
jgi:hypothetical protein